MNLIETGHHQVNADCDPYLGSHGVLAGAEECFDAQVLLDPFEEQFDLPASFVDRCDDLCRQIEVIGQEDQAFAGLGIKETDTPEFFRIGSLAFVSAQPDGLVAAHTAGLVDWARLTEVESRIAFRPNDEVGVSAFDSKESSEVEVSSIKDIDTPSLNEHPIHEVDVMHRTVCDLYKDWDRASQVDLSMELYRGFGLTEMSPRKHRQAQINGGSIDRINHLVNIQPVGVLAVKASGLADENLRECFVNTPVPVLVSISQISPRDVTTDAHGVEMRTPSQASFNVTKTLSESDLSKSHRKKLIPGGHTLARSRHRVKLNAASQLLGTQYIHYLGKYESSCVHPLLRMNHDRKYQSVQMQDTPFPLLAA